MFHHNQGVSDIAQALQRGDEALVIALVQTNGGLIQHVEDSRQAGANLGGEANTLCFAARQRGGAAVKGEVVQADVEKEAQAGLDLLEHSTSNDLLAVAQHERVEELRRLLDGQCRQASDGLLAMRGRGQTHRQDFRLQAGTATSVTRHTAGVLKKTVLLRLGIRLIELALQKADSSLERRGPVTLAAIAVLVAHTDFHICAIDQGVALLLGELGNRGARIKVQGFRQAFDQLDKVPRIGARRPWLDGLNGRGIRVRDQQIHIHLKARAQAITHRAGTERRVERERAGLVFLNGQRVAVRAGSLFRVSVREIFAVYEIQGDESVCQAQRRLDRIRQPLLLGSFHLQAVHDDIDVVLDLLLQLRRVTELVKLPIYPNTGVTLGREVSKEVNELALTSANDRCEDLEFQLFLVA